MEGSGTLVPVTPSDGSTDSEQGQRRSSLLSDEAAAAAGGCAKACAELVDTEAAYCRTLETLMETFVTPLQQWATEDEHQGGPARGGGITPAEVRSVFGGVETLWDNAVSADARRAHAVSNSGGCGAAACTALRAVANRTDRVPGMCPPVGARAAPACAGGHAPS